MSSVQASINNNNNNTNTNTNSPDRIASCTRDKPTYAPSMASSTTEAPAEFFDFKLYRYTPSLAAAIVSVIVFAVLTALHTWRMLKARAYYFMAFTIGGVCKFNP